MLLTKRLLLRLFFAFEIFIFLSIYLLSTQGIQALFRMHHEYHAIEKHIEMLEREVKELEHYVDEWQQSSFYKEKLAREKLYLARKGEQVFVF